MFILEWPVKKLKYLIVAASLHNARTGWIDQAANIQILILYNYIANTLCIRFLFLPLRGPKYGLYLLLTIGLSLVLLMPYIVAMYDIFHRRLLQSAEATRYAMLFSSNSAISRRQQLCGLLILALQPGFTMGLLLAVGMTLGLRW